MTKMILVDNCGNCFRYGHGCSVYRDMSQNEAKELFLSGFDERNSIHSDCPLPDAPEDDEEYGESERTKGFKGTPEELVRHVYGDKWKPEKFPHLFKDKDNE